MIIVVGSIVTNDENREAILAESIAHCQRSRRETGCISHEVHQDCEASDRLVFVEKWIDAKSLLRHFAVPESSAFIRSVSGLSTEAPEMKVFDSVEIDPAKLAE